MKGKLLLIVILTVLLPVSRSSAQDGDGCDPASLKIQFGEAIQRAETLDDLNRLSAEIVTTLAACAPKVEMAATYSFEGTGTSIVGPFELAPGVYVVDYTAENPSSTTSDLELRLEHKTDFFSVHSYAWRPLTGRALMQINAGGTHIINVDSHSAWTLTITPFDLSVQTDVLAVASDTLQDVWGPFELEEGYYTLEYTDTVDPTGWGAHFYLHLLDAQTLRMVASASDAANEGTIEGEQAVYVESGTYLFEIEADGSLDWSVWLARLQ